jgi:phosphatidylinositol 3-kinase
MEFVEDSTTIQEVLSSNNKDVTAFLKSQSDDPARQAEIMHNYLISNAGYAVATYFLAVGDRHLENLLVKNNGDLFHLDFGFILGSNPKSKGDFWVPPIRINSHMVRGMGGQHSKEYEVFKQKTIDAFLYLRNYRQLFLNILLMMVNASIPDLPFAQY